MSTIVPQMLPTFEVVDGIDSYAQKVEWLANLEGDAIILDLGSDLDAWHKGSDAFWYRLGVEAGYNPECVALGGPFLRVVRR